MNESVIPARAGIQVATGTQGGNDNWAPTSAGATTDKRWFVPELITLPLAARRCLVRNALNGAALELSSGEHAVLTTCEGCHTLAEHEARAATRLRAPEEHIPAIRELLGRYRARFDGGDCFVRSRRFRVHLAILNIYFVHVIKTSFRLIDL